MWGHGRACGRVRARMARAPRLPKSKQILRELVDRDGTVHQVWVTVLPAAGELGCRSPDFARKGKKRLRLRRDAWEIKRGQSGPTYPSWCASSSNLIPISDSIILRIAVSSLIAPDSLPQTSLAIKAHSVILSLRDTDQPWSWRLGAGRVDSLRSGLFLALATHSIEFERHTSGAVTGLQRAARSSGSSTSYVGSKA